MERANVVQRITQRVASTRPVAFIFLHTFHHVDRALYRFGSPHHPAWYHNLLANPHAEMERDGTKSAVVARSVPDGPEYDAVMHAADAVYSGFPIYRRRITARRVPIFVLQPPA